jgi:hypothetical protein
MRHPVRPAIDKFNGLLGLNEQPYMQDWEIECADPGRVMEFIRCYDLNAKTDDEKFTLMALILGSYEEYHSANGPRSEEWNAIKVQLEADLAVHCDHILYYGCPESDDEEEWFPITTQVRELLPKCAQPGA